MVRPDRTAILSKTEIQSLAHIKYVADTIVHSVLSNAEFIFLVMKNVGKLVETSIDEHRSHNIEVA